VEVVEDADDADDERVDEVMDVDFVMMSDLERCLEIDCSAVKGGLCIPPSYKNGLLVL